MKSQAFGEMGNQKYLEYASDIHLSGAHLLEVINEILDLAKIEAGQLTIEDDIVSLESVLEVCSRMVAERAIGKGLKLELSIPNDLPLVRADRRQMKQMVLNLLTNAIKFTQSGGQVFLSAGTGGDGARIVVKDTGIGIAKKDVSRIMEPFGQVSNVFSRGHEGSGLGLPLVDAMITLHGGTLSIDSTLGEGTSVSLNFPKERIVSE